MRTSECPWRLAVRVGLAVVASAGAASAAQSGPAHRETLILAQAADVGAEPDWAVCAKERGTQGYDRDQSVAMCTALIDSGRFAGAQLADLYRIRGWTHRAAGGEDAALADLQQAVAIQPEFSQAWRNLAGMLLAVGRMDEALEAIETAVRTGPRDPANYRALARVFKDMGRAVEGQEVIAHMRALAPDDSEFQRIGGWSLLELGDRAGALAAFRRALSLDPDDTQAMYGLAYVLGEAGRVDEAHEEISRAIEVADAAAYRAFRGGIALQEQTPYYDPAAAIADFEQATALDPSDSWSFYMLAAAQAQQDRPDAALARLRDALAVGSDPRGLRLVIRVLQARGHAAAAEEAQKLSR